MGLTIENCKGHVHVFGDGGGGFYAIKPAIPEVGGAKALILGVPLEFQEIVQPTTTLDDKRVLYLFGTAWNRMSVAGILLLGDRDTKGAQLTRLLKWYNDNRVSESKKPIRVSLGTASLDAYVVGLRLGEANAKTNTQMFSIILLTADVEA